MILNLTQHPATPEQIAAGVVAPERDTKIQIVKLLTINDLPISAQLQNRADALAEICEGWGHKTAMIGGAPFLMSYLEKSLKAAGIKPLYAFSKRVVLESVQENGEVLKKMIFKHLGFVEA